MAEESNVKTVNILGDTQRAQWISVVKTINHVTDYKCDELCKEVVRYINFAEDVFGKIENNENENERLKTLLYNAVSLLVDETYEQYDDVDEWKNMLYNELDTTEEELKKYINIVV